MTEEVLKEGGLLVHPIRFKIVKKLREEKRPMYVDEIATSIEVDRRLVSFHLTTLEKFGFAESEFMVINKPQSKGKAGRFYKLTPKVESVLGDLAEAIKPN